MLVGKLIADYRFANRIGTRDMAKEIGISHATLNRVENGNDCDSGTLTRIMWWLFGEGPETRQQKPKN